jgi:hypothetical protein
MKTEILFVCINSDKCKKQGSMCDHINPHAYLGNDCKGHCCSTFFPKNISGECMPFNLEVGDKISIENIITEKWQSPQFFENMIVKRLYPDRVWATSKNICGQFSYSSYKIYK